jgi:aspartate aminotransferase-like enzyme
MCEATTRFAGLSAFGTGLVTIAGIFKPGRAAVWARIGTAGMVASVTVAAVLQAVDRVALRVVVDRRAASEGEARRLAYEAPCALRWTEIGVARLVGILFGRSP